MAGTQTDSTAIVKSDRLSVSPASSPLTRPQGSYEGEDETIAFTNVEKLGEFLEDYKKDFLICKGVDVGTYRQITKWICASGRRYRLFFPGMGDRLFITVPSGEHEVSHTMIEICIVRDSMRMGMGLDSWCSGAGTTFSSRGGGGGGEGDTIMVPRPERDGLGWPTLVIESGRSQSLTSLRSKMEWWFRESEHQVQIVLLVKLSMIEHTILIEKYTESVSAQSGPLTGPAPAVIISRDTLRPFLRQTINIVPDENTNPVTYSVTRGSLLLEFALLRLRPAVPGNGEHDTIVTENDLVTIAREVWVGLI